MNHPRIASWLAAGCGLVLPLALAQSDTPPTPPPTQQREVEKRLEMRRSAPDGEARREEAGRMREGARPGEGRRGPYAGPGGDVRREGAPAIQAAEVRELRRNRAQLTDKLERLRNEGADEDTVNVKQRIAEIDRRMAQMAEARRPRPQPDRPRTGPEGQPGPGPRGPEAERRLQHLAVAIDNLRAAGMHEAAERLAREREEMAQRMQNGRGSGQGRPAPEVVGEIRRLRAELDEVRQALGALKGRIEELHQDRR